ncbi:MAG: alternate-type signal peptide domain-containing protein [Beutenbergiaceae bacterium]
MKKTTRGALAAAAAALLLVGGAGTLAYWTAEQTLSGGSVTSGELTLSAPTCDSDWVYAAGNASAGSTVTLIVPGDTIVKECTFTIGAQGDNLEAAFSTPATVPIATVPASSTFSANVAATYTIGGTTAPATITEANDGDTVTATIEVEFPFGDDTTINANDTQDVVASLDAITVSLIQSET